MSNDQSPPARKVIPYKKGGRRQSPFSEMALRFSGTALDVAIQQREQEAEATPPESPETESPADEYPPAEARRAADRLSEAQLNQPDTSFPAGPPATPPVADEPKLPTAAPVRRQSDRIQKRPPGRSVRLLPPRRSKSSARVVVPPELEDFIERWGPFLTDAQIAVCIYIYNNSTAINQEYCFTSVTKLMAAISKSERQIYTVLSQLLDWEFLLRGEVIVNVPREQRGTYYKLNTDKS